jgi:ribosomal protein S24E
MNKAELESYVKRSFHLTLKDFLKQRIEGDGFFDREIADTLHVSISTAHKLRKQYGIKKADTVLKRFETTYGPGAVQLFQDIIEDPSTSLSDVGRSFGFTRENARQVYQKIYGFPYTEAHRQKLLHRRSEADSLKFSSRRLIHLKAVKEKLTAMGLAPTMVFEGNVYLLLTNNNLKVGVLYNGKLRQIGNSQYFAVRPIHKQKQGCDVFILTYLHKGVRGYYIIPHRYIPKDGTMITVSADDTNGKYTRFKDAWDVLVNP